MLKSYNYPFAYQNNLSCIYRIILSATNTSPKSICFKFHRFHLETSTPFCSFDFVQIDKIKYCGMGVWQYGLQPSNPEYNVWSESFCCEYTVVLLTISMICNYELNTYIYLTRFLMFVFRDCENTVSRYFFYFG